MPELDPRYGPQQCSPLPLLCSLTLARHWPAAAAGRLPRVPTGRLCSPQALTGAGTGHGRACRRRGKVKRKGHSSCTASRYANLIIAGVVTDRWTPKASAWRQSILSRQAYCHLRHQLISMYVVLLLLLWLLHAALSDECTLPTSHSASRHVGACCARLCEGRCCRVAAGLYLRLASRQRRRCALPGEADNEGPPFLRAPTTTACAASHSSISSGSSSSWR